MAYKAWDGWLHLDGWAGRTWQAVRVIGETKKRYQIEAVGEAVRLAGRCRSLSPGATALVPKYALTRKAPCDCVQCVDWRKEGKKPEFRCTECGAIVLWCDGGGPTEADPDGNKCSRCWSAAPDDG